MKNEITVKEAIKKGHHIVTIPTFVIMLLGFGLTIYLASTLSDEWVIEPFGIIFSLLSMWLCWSVMITRWKIWAFTNVRNVHELKQKAINESLIYPDGNFLTKTEIRTKQQKEDLKKLEEKFKVPDVIEKVSDNGSVKEETKIYFSKTEKWINIGMIFLLIGLGGYLLFTGVFLWGGLLIAGAIFYWKFLIADSLTNEPQIILNEEGIKGEKTSLIKWKNVTSILTVVEGSGNSARSFLEIGFHRGNKNIEFKEKIPSQGLNKGPDDIEELAKLYRQRNLQKGKNKTN